MKELTSNIVKIQKQLKRLDKKLDVLLPQYIEQCLELHRENLAKKTLGVDVDITPLTSRIKEIESFFGCDRVVKAVNKQIDDPEAKKMLLRHCYAISETLGLERKAAIKQYGRADSPQMQTITSRVDGIQIKRNPQLPLFFRSGQEQLELGWSAMSQERKRRSSFHRA